PKPAENSTAAENAPAVQAVLVEVMSPLRATGKPVSQAPPTVRPVPPFVPALGEVIATTGAILSRTKVREAEPLLPAPSVCETLTSLLPSPFEKVIAELYEPAVQVAALLAATPEPLIVIG